MGREGRGEAGEVYDVFEGQRKKLFAQGKYEEAVGKYALVSSGLEGGCCVAEGRARGEACRGAKRRRASKTLATAFGMGMWWRGDFGLRVRKLRTVRLSTQDTAVDHYSAPGRNT